MTNIFQFITKRSLWVNILAGIALMVIVFFIFVFFLRVITKHGKSRLVPDVTGKTFDEAKQLLRKDDFGYEVVDSVYIDSLPPLAIVRQVPDGDAVVKIDRTVYLTINRAVPPQVEMPNLLGFSHRSAEMQLANLGLKIGSITYKPDFAKNSVLEVLYNGTEIKPGTRIQMGSSVSLVLGDGLGDTEYPVPALLGMKYMDAQSLLASSGINIFVAVAAGVTDTAAAYIYQQDPARFSEEGKLNKIRPGQMISVWLQTERPLILSDSTKPVPQELLNY